MLMLILIVFFMPLHSMLNVKDTIVGGCSFSFKILFYLFLVHMIFVLFAELPLYAPHTQYAKHIVFVFFFFFFYHLPLTHCTRRIFKIFFFCVWFVSKVLRCPKYESEVTFFIFLVLHSANGRQMISTESQK